MEYLKFKIVYKENFFSFYEVPPIVKSTMKYVRSELFEVIVWNGVHTYRKLTRPRYEGSEPV